MDIGITISKVVKTKLDGWLWYDIYGMICTSIDVSLRNKTRNTISIRPIVLWS